ncbi:hypothetical protein ABEY43_26030 [Priestia megaterium]|uniref:hypothetical protein n=1 Tax=Priestia megaterium TaxID=1404 RepID=UPI002E248F84
MAYLFYEMEKSSKNSPTSKLEHNEDHRVHDKSYISDPKKKETKVNKKEKGRKTFSFFIYLLCLGTFFIPYSLYSRKKTPFFTECLN